MTSRVPPELAAYVMQRAAGRCEYCHAPQVLIGQAFHIDHIIPQSADGATVCENLCLACPHCNIAKRNRTEAQDPRTRREVSLFNPRTDRWLEHFRWSADWTTLIGPQPCGSNHSGLPQHECPSSSAR